MSNPRFQEAKTRSFVAAADLSANKYHAVKLSANQEEVEIAGAGEGIGILMNSPIAGDYAEVAMIGGGALGHSGAAIAKGAAVAADAAGKLVTATSGAVVLGIALSEAVAADEYFEIDRVYDALA